MSDDDVKAAEVNGAVPEFDFSRTNRAWRKRWLRRITRATRLQVTILEAEEAGNKITSTEATASAKALEELEGIAEEQEQMVAEVLVSVPAEFLHPDAPEDPDWSDPDFDEWLLDGSFEIIIQALNEARSPKN